MVFSSAAFLFLFLPATFLLLYPLPRRAQNYGLLAASILFYLWGAGSYIWVIGVVSLISWALGWAIAKFRTQKYAIAAIAAAILLIGIPLIYFKYAPVIAGYLNPGAFENSIILPLGISFFTFHAISYVVDIYRGEIEPAKNLSHYLLYLFIFPHQIAGPIVRFSEIKDEIASRHRARSEDVIYGLARFGWGLFKKVFVADQAGAVADTLFEYGWLLNGSTAWIAVTAYAIQIYFDFSAYSDMALGIARVFNFHFPENFTGPYRARSATEFWQRWHMTLSRWFRDYVYIPFGGNRKGKVREYAGLLLTFALTSLWHGANWNYLVWGGMWSGLLLFERITGLRKVQKLQMLRRAFMIFFIIFSWVPFRISDMSDVTEIWGLLLSGELGPLHPIAIVELTPLAIAALAVGLIAFITPQRIKGRTFDYIALRPDGEIRVIPTLLVGLVALVLGVIFSLASSFSPFLYYQF